MKPKPRCKAKRANPKSILRLPDLEVAKSAVLNSLSCPDAQRGYRHAIDEFVEWYCSEPRLSFSKTVVVRRRMHLESRRLAPGAINLRLGASAVLRTRRQTVGCSAPTWQRDPARQGRKEAGRETRRLVDRRTGASAVAGAGPRADQGQT